MLMVNSQKNGGLTSSKSSVKVRSSCKLCEHTWIAGRNAVPRFFAVGHNSGSPLAAAAL